MKRFSGVFFSFLFLVIGQASAAVYYAVPVEPQPVYYRPVYAYRGPTGAALAPWAWNFDFGGGPTSIAGSNQILDSGWNFELGGGANITPNAGFVFEYMNHGLSVDNNYLQNNNAIDGYSHVWSLTLNPIWRYQIGGPIGGYIIGGGGFYERQIDLTQPFFQNVPGGFISGYAVNRQTDDTGGLNIGMGFTCHLGYGTKLFVEARYHYIFTSGGATRLVPVTIGFRW